MHWNFFFTKEQTIESLKKAPFYEERLKVFEEHIHSSSIAVLQNQARRLKDVASIIARKPKKLFWNDNEFLEDLNLWIKKQKRLPHPFLKSSKCVLSNYMRLAVLLTKEELDVILELPDKTTKNGYRDYVILTLMYNTCARVSEISNTRVSDLDIASADGTICIHGKGNKTRTCPLTKKTTLLLRSFIDYDREFLFYGARNNPITRFGIYNIVKKYIEQAKKECLSLKKKKITPHSFRHTAATHMILAKEDLNTVRMMLGHSSLQTTMRYTKLNGEQLRHAIEHCAYLPKTNAIWKSDLSIKERLKSL